MDLDDPADLGPDRFARSLGAGLQRSTETYDSLIRVVLPVGT